MAGQLRPDEGYRLEFDGNLRPVSTNDFPTGTIFDSLALNSTNVFTLRGNAVRLLNGLTSPAQSRLRILDLPIELIGSQSWQVSTGVVSVLGAFSGGNALTLTKDGAGTLLFFGSSPNRFGGTLIVRGSQVTLEKDDGTAALAGPLVLEATDQAATALIKADGQFSNSPPVTLIGNPSKLARIIFNSTAGVNVIGTLTIDGSRIHVDAGAAVQIQGDLNVGGAAPSLLELGFNSADAAASKLIVSGRIHLANSQLIVIAGTVEPGVPLMLVRNDGEGPVDGAFLGLPEGTTVVSGPRTFHITYRGGDGNDIVLLNPASVSSPSALNGIVVLPAGARQINGLGLAGLSYVLEATTNLNPTAVWIPLLTNTADGAGVFQFVDPGSTDLPHRFYRVKSP